MTSVNVGGQISFFVSTADSTFTLDIYRTGWYGGVGARLLATVSNLSGGLQPTPLPDPSTGIVECHWSSAYTLIVPQTWTTGIYLGRLTGISGKQSYTIFVVRNDASHSDLIFESSVTTFEAYNFWPGGSGGTSLYNWAPGGPVPFVSFNRPYVLGFSYVPGVNEDAASGVGAGEYLTNEQPGPQTPLLFYPIPAAGWEYNMVRWLEANGYDVSYVTNIDVHENGGLLLNHKGFLSVGHNEYWSTPMRQSVQNALNAGVNLAFFSSNTMYWQIRLQPGYDNAPDRTIVCYKTAAVYADPDYLTNPQLATVEWRNTPVNMPEAGLIGVEYVGDPWTADIVVSNASHWLFNGSGLQNGDHLTGLLGYEVDSFVPGTSPANTQILASSPVGPFTDTDDAGLDCAAGCYSNVTWYPYGNGSVFAAGTMFWSWGLDDYNAPALRPVVSTPAAQQVVKNVLASFINPITITVGSALPQAFTAAPYRTSFSARGGASPFTWSASGLPAYLTMDSSGNLTGTPPAAANLSFTVTATDSAQHAATGNFTLAITGTLQFSAVLPPGVVGLNYSYQFMPVGGAGPYTWTASGLPAGLSLSTGGALSGIPAAPGTTPVTVTVTDSLNAVSSSVVNLVVNPALQVPNQTLPAGIVGTGYSYQFLATGGIMPYVWSAPILPPGLTLSSTGMLTGSPVKAKSATFKVTATDATQVAASTNASIVIGSTPPAITNANPGQVPNGTVGASYSYQFTETGGTKPLLWAASGLPTGLTIGSGGGSLHGKPTTAGTYPVLITLTDATSLSTTANVTLTISPAAFAILNANPGQVPAGAVGTSYSYQFIAKNGTTPYTWTATGLSPGLIMGSGGKLHGTPTATLNGPVTITATDANHNTATATFTLVIN